MRISGSLQRLRRRHPLFWTSRGVLAEICGRTSRRLHPRQSEREGDRVLTSSQPLALSAWGLRQWETETATRERGVSRGQQDEARMNWLERDEDASGRAEQKVARSRSDWTVRRGPARIAVRAERTSKGFRMPTTLYDIAGAIDLDMALGGHSPRAQQSAYGLSVRYK